MRPDKFECVSVLDEAIDSESIPLETMQAYYNTRDLKLIAQHYRPGVSPTKFFVRSVPHSLWESYVCSAGEYDEIRYRRAFICGVERVENLYGDDGVSVPNWAPTRSVPGSPLVILSDDECNKHFTPQEVNEIGSVIYKHSFLSRRTKLTYLLPPSCVEPLAQRRFLRVDLSQSTASTPTNSQPSASTDHQTAATERSSV